MAVIYKEECVARERERERMKNKDQRKTVRKRWLVVTVEK